MEQLIKDTANLKLSEENIATPYPKEPEEEVPRRSARAKKTTVSYSEEPEEELPRRSARAKNTTVSYAEKTSTSKKRTAKKEEPVQKPSASEVVYPEEPTKPAASSKKRTTKKKESVQKEASKPKTKRRPVSLPNKKRTTFKNNRMVKSLPDYLKSLVKKEDSVVDVVNTLDSPDFLKIKEDLQEGNRPWLKGDIQEILFRSLVGTSSPVKKGAPELLVLVGPPASGKSTVKKQLNFTNALNLDVDEIQIETQKIYGNKNTFKIMKDYPTLIQFIAKKAIYGNYNMILDTTGKMKAPIKYVIKKAKEAGYKITMAFIYTTVEKCIQNIEHRNATNAERKPIPKFVVEKTYNEFKDTGIVNYYLMHSPELMKKIDHLYLVDNSQAPNPAQIVFEQHLHARPKVNIAFPNFYNIKVSFDAPYFSKVK